MAEHGDQPDEALVLQLAVAQVQHVHTAEVAVSEDLPGHFVDTYARWLIIIM